MQEFRRLEKIHYHSDCPFFAGCENMLVNFFSSPQIHSDFKISFSYRYSYLYESGLHKRVKINFNTYPLHFFNLFDIKIFPKWVSPLFEKVTGLFLRWLLTYPIILHEIVVLRRLFLKIKPDIVHINNGGYPAALSARAAAIAAKLAGIKKIIMVVNNLAVGYSKPNRWLDYPIDQLVIRCVSNFITGSKAAREQLIKVLRLSESAVAAIPNGIAIREITETRLDVLKRIGVKEEVVLLGVVAVLRPNKGHHILLKAISIIYKNRPELLSQFKVIIEGDGPSLELLKAYVCNHQLSSYCSFIGNETNVMNFMSAVDIIILPSVGEEDFPNVVVEAMGLGKPVIGTSVAGIPEQIVDGVTGIIVEPGDALQMANAIITLLDNAELRVSMELKGRARYIEKFNEHLAVVEYLTLYQKPLRS